MSEIEAGIQVAKEAEKIIPEAVEGAENLARKGIFQRITGVGKKVLGIASRGATSVGAYEIGRGIHTLGNKLGNAQRNAQEQAADNNPNSSLNSRVPNPGANSPAGKVDLPRITPAAETAAGVNAAEVTGNLRGSGYNKSRATDGAQLNRIIELLDKILGTEKEAIRQMGSGFTSISNALINNAQSQNNAEEASNIEQGSSSRNSGASFLSGMGGFVARTSLKGIGAGILGAAAFGLGAEALSKVHKDDKKGANAQKQTASIIDKDITESKKQFGEKEYATKLIQSILKAHQDIFRKIQKEYPNKTDRVIQEYALFKPLYVKLDKEGKQQLIDVLATINQKTPQEVKQIIAHQNRWATQAMRAVGTGIVHGGSAALADVQSLAVKGFGNLEYGLDETTSWMRGNFGDYKQEEYYDKLAKKERKSAYRFADDNSSTWADNGKSADSPINIRDSMNHPDLFKTGAAVGGAAVGGVTTGPGGVIAAGASAAAGAVTGAVGAKVNSKHEDDIYSSGKKSSIKKMNLTPDVKRKAEQAVAFFKSKGWTTKQAEGIVANLLVESNYTLDPHQKQLGGGGGYGIAQWTSKDRKEKFKEIEGVSLEQSTLNQQLHFVNWELNNTEKGAGNKLKATTTVEDASKAITAYYERPAAIQKQKAFRATVAESLQSSINPEDLVPKQPEVASAASQSAPIVIQKGGSTVSQSTHISTASAMPPPQLHDNVTASIG